MNVEIRGAEVWIVNRQEHWRQQETQELMRAGFRVRAFSAYGELLAATEAASPDLILLGCIRCREEEETLLNQLVQRSLHVLIVASSFSISEICSLFLCGAMDVLQRPSKSAELLAIIDADLASIHTQPNLLTA